MRFLPTVGACVVLLGHLLCCLTATTISATAAAEPAKGPVIIMSWDGAADWVIDRLLAENKLPHVARLARTGVRTQYCMPAFPSKTACGHAALWTGAYADVNGITGNSVPVLPRAQHTILETRSGFASESLLAEPLYVTAAKAGKKVVVLSATQSFPPEPWVKALAAANVPRERFVIFSGFESQIEGERVWNGAELKPVVAQQSAPLLPPYAGEAKSFTLNVGDTPFTVLVYDDPADPTRGMDTVRISREGAAIVAGASAPTPAPAATLVTLKTLKPAPGSVENVRHFSSRFLVTKGDLTGYVYFRLFELGPDGRMVLYQRGVNALRGASTPEEQRAYLDAYGGFHAAPFGLYEEGALGKTLWQQGGNGEAERRLLEIIRLDCEFLKSGTRYALRQYRPDLLFHYTPMSDGAGHTWMGVLDPQSPRYDRSIADKLWPFYTQVFQLQDEWLGAVLDAAGSKAVVCLVSDHGMAGVGKRFNPNTVLEKAGLLVRTADNKIDLARTKACFPPWSDYALVVNGTDWKGGIVASSSGGEREGVLQQAREALLAAVDPETGQHVVTGVFRPDDIAHLGIGGPSGGDLYLELAPGYSPSSRTGESIVSKDDSPIGSGVHGFLPLRKTMQAICFMGGAGVARGRQVPGIRQIDVAPTLSRLLGIPAPRDAQGHVVGEILRQ